MRHLASLSGCLLFVATASAQNVTRSDFATARSPDGSQTIIRASTSHSRPPSSLAAPNIPTYCPEQLLRMDEVELTKVYKCGLPSPVPCGYVPGTVIFQPGSKLTVPTSRMLHLTAWQGKYIQDGVMANRQFGLPTIKAAISQGTSWIDGGPSLIFDYEEMSWICSRYRDEVREVSPGVYLGCMHKRTKEGPEIAVWFALDARVVKGCLPFAK